MAVKRELSFANGFIKVDGVKIYSQEKSFELMVITRPTYFKYVKQGKISRIKVTGPLDGDKPRWGVSEHEIRRVKAIIDAGWIRGKSKLPKKRKE